ncbi:LysE family translocator [Reinekea sp.]|jgi:threonine/homoserine/homoserine lactone efflux protein|uniref:LysE family translocator n=1 Tax=Reinekea sp. TaxID=1970455 RepID=UPI003989FD5F
MTLAAWLSIVGICSLGAISPGPSLAVVLKHTLNGGKRQGYITAITHGIGVGLYAIACISGLAFVLIASEWAFTLLQWAGAAYLAWMGIKGLMSKSNPNQKLEEVTATQAARDGFFIVFFNPKIAVFFIALFSQVIGPETTLVGKAVYASTAMVIDMGWYLIVAWLFSNERWLEKLQQKATLLDRIFGVILLLLASKIAFSLS